MPWMRHRLRDAEVWANVDAAGALVKEADGRVAVIYKAAPGAKVYRAGARNLTPLGGAPVEVEVELDAPAAKPTGSAAAPAIAAPADAIHVWTDGGASPNPGPAGLGVVVIDGERKTELSEYLGHGTNNIAELTAIQRGLETVVDRSRPVMVYSDSKYSIDMLTKNWRAKENVELIARLRALCKTFANLRFVKVLGHSGVALNERTDELATQAIARRR